MKTTLLKNDLATVFLLFIMSLSLFAQESIQVSGVISTDKTPIPDINIQIESKAIGTKSDAKGFYSIKAEVGDKLLFTHVSFEPVQIIVEDVTSELNLNMLQRTNRLNETIVTARKAQKAKMSLTDKMHTEIETAVGKLNPMAFPSKVHYFEGKDINHYSNLSEALNGKISGKIPQIFDVDGIIYRDDTFINISRIIELYVVTGKAGTMRWGGPVVIVRTLDHPDEIKARKEEKAEQYRNQNYYNNDAVSVAEDNVVSSSASETTNKTSQQKEIYGIITYLDSPLADVNIVHKGTSRGTKSNNKGAYKITVDIGDELEYSHISFQTVHIIIEDVTAEINIDMVDKENTLDEVLVIAKTKEGKIIERAKNANESFNTSRGTINPNSAGYALSFVDGDEISNLYASVKNALVGKISGYTVNPVNGKAYLRGGNSSATQDYPVAWEIDGVFTSDEPIGLDLSQIESIQALKSLAATNKYGTLGAGGVIVITTKFGNFNAREAQLKKVTEQYTNNNFYSDDAVALNPEDVLSNSYTDAIEAFKNKGKAYYYYQDNLKHSIEEFDIHITIAQKFLRHYNDKQKAIFILNELAEKHRNNSEILKAVAFNLQSINATRDALNKYRKVAKLRPNYAQSYRDLANAYKENNDFKMSWRIYMNYLLNRDIDKAGAIDQIVYNEMEYLYFNRQDQTQIKEQFVPNSENKLKFRNDVRFVVEWNTSEAEFDLEFVGSDRRSYVFEHTLNSNQSLITDEKTNGFTSEEFFIDDIGIGEWLVNLTYYGNKKSAPTYFKLTTYYHWGKPEQTQEIAVYKLDNTEQKLQLKKVNEESLITLD